MGLDGDTRNLAPVLIQQAHGDRRDGLVEAELDLRWRLGEAGAVWRSRLDQHGVSEGTTDAEGEQQHPGDQEA